MESGRFETKLGEGTRGPTAAITSRGLRDEKEPTDPQEGGGALRHDRRWSECPSRDDVEASPVTFGSPDVLCPSHTNLNPTIESQPGNGFGQWVGPSLHCLDQNPG